MSSTLAELRTAFRRGSLSKPEFIQAMYRQHASLFAYPGELGPRAGIQEIHLAPEGVWMRLAQPDIRMWCPEGDARMAPLEAFNFGGFETTEFELVSRLVAAETRLPGYGVLDIGANAGLYSLGLRARFPTIPIGAFEPVPETYALLRRNLELNGMNNVTTHNYGLSDRAGEVEFFTYRAHSGASSSVKLLDDVEATRIVCQLRRLDEIAPDLGFRVALIKCDVEGGELRVLEGGAALVGQDRPVIFLEMLRKWCRRFGYHPNDIIDFLGRWGYRCFAVGASGLRACPSVDEDTLETNFVFLDEERHARHFPTHR